MIEAIFHARPLDGWTIQYAGQHPTAEVTIVEDRSILDLTGLEAPERRPRW